MQSFKEYLKESTEEKFIHYSHKPNLTRLDPNFYGAGIRGSESSRLDQTKDTRIKKRVYFYPPVNGGLPRPEVGLGNHVYEAPIPNLHDARMPSPEANKIALTAQEHIKNGEHPDNAYERAVLDHGYSGIRTDNIVVVLNKDVPVKYSGTSLGKTVVDHVINTKPPKKSIFDGIPDSQGEHSSSLLTPVQSSYWIKNRDRLKQAAPSVKMQYGRLMVHKDHLDSLKKELDTTPDHPL